MMAEKCLVIVCKSEFLSTKKINGIPFQAEMNGFSDSKDMWNEYNGNSLDCYACYGS